MKQPRRMHYRTMTKQLYLSNEIWAERKVNCVAICDCDTFSSNTGKSQLAKDSQPGPSI